MTLLVDPIMLPRIKQEMAEHPQPRSSLDRVQIIEIVERNEIDIVDDLKTSGKDTMPAYLRELFKPVNSGVITRFRPPTLAIFDVSGHN